MAAVVVPLVVVVVEPVVPMPLTVTVFAGPACLTAESCCSSGRPPLVQTSSVETTTVGRIPSYLNDRHAHLLPSSVCTAEDSGTSRAQVRKVP